MSFDKNFSRLEDKHFINVVKQMIGTLLKNILNDPEEKR